MFKRPGDFRIRLDGGRPRHEDLVMLDVLRGEHGADLAKPRSVRLLLRFPDERSAFEAGKLLHSARFAVSGVPPEDEDEDGSWGLRAVGEAQIDPSNVADFRARFEGIARSFGGDLERWEAAARP